MIKYEIRERNTTTQFATIKAVKAYNATAEIFEVEEDDTIIIEPSLNDWYNLEQALFTSTLFSKGITSEGNGFALLLKVLTNGSTKGTSQNLLLTAIQLTIKGINDFTQEDIDSLNGYLQLYNFRIKV